MAHKQVGSLLTQVSSTADLQQHRGPEAVTSGTPTPRNSVHPEPKGCLLPAALCLPLHPAHADPVQEFICFRNWVPAESGQHQPLSAVA